MSIKLSEEEITRLNELQNNWNVLTQKAGQLQYQQRILNAELDDVYAEIEQLDIQRYEVAGTLEEKYGQGQINLLTGEFIPDTSPQQTNGV